MARWAHHHPAPRAPRGTAEAGASSAERGQAPWRKRYLPVSGARSSSSIGRTRTQGSAGICSRQPSPCANAPSRRPSA